MRKILTVSAFFVLSVCLQPHAAKADSASAVAGKMGNLPDGAAVYKHVCQSCHMPDGKGAEGAGAHFPALAGNPKLQSAEYPASVILNGFGGMPWFAGMLNDQQVANVVNYIRTHFGNHYTDTLKPSDVADMRPHLTVEDE
ncbi:c-type cytochrome [Acetobacter indonesiensis]|uniref:c-type cytochrome n=1 Tax=Acetobacter indonesiensis TaxID=104101 RepID=UPI0020A4E017|nr:cytochrome c [Acetobacter indonesiensis]MCP1231375.1 cytochrome c [Acetobacter indonesiensis]